MRTYVAVRGGRVSEVAADVVREQPLTIHVNGEKFLTLLCSPMMLEALVIGYLWMEKVIGGVDEIARVEVSAVDGRADVALTHEVTLPTERILTSGCGGGITFRIDHRLFPRLHSRLRVAPSDICQRMKGLFGAAVHYKESRGIHGAALADPSRLLVVAEDVGRHNAVDKVMGWALLEKRVPAAGTVLMVSGRASFELVQKASLAGLAGIVAVGAPSSLAVDLATDRGVTLCGFVRGGSANVYTEPWRIER
jgi:FdhD protein